MSYPDVAPQPDFPALERAVLDRWDAQQTFEQSIIRREQQGADEFVFYDGPPFANGLPHFGHLLTGYVKDAVPRYRTMRGNLVRRVFGWDCHGLPAEVEAEKELGISGHPEITQFGIGAFNDACRTSVLRYTEEWRRYVTRQARWVDFDHGYKTLDLTYMESVMWAFKQLWDKGLVYEGFKVLAYCWRCETPLSNTETRMDDVYVDRQDPALTVGFELLAQGGEPADPLGELLDGALMLAWTTTPWTLPANLALAVGPDIRYAVVAHGGHRYVLAENRLTHYAAELGRTVAGDDSAADGGDVGTDAAGEIGFEVLGVVTGADLAGRRYRPLFDFFADHDRYGTERAFQVLAEDFVLTDEGTGIVHMAPGFGEDDQNACNTAGIPTIVPMDEHGQYTAAITTWAGTHVFDANPLVIRTLKERGAGVSGSVLRHETYDHSYPHCWRCAKPLVYRAISSWFVAVSTFRDRMVELNEDINWVPAHVKHGMFGKWIANARDWSISRNRFWGSPIPVWKSDDPNYPRLDVYGSLQQLADDFGVPVDDLHRPAIDELTRPNPDDPTGKSTMRRVPEVLDCWFESGSMPFAQVHYPFENAEWFESHYPGDFIVEYHPQTRGWFYTMHVLATALFDRPAFRTCISHGTILGDDGQKASKSLKNYPDPMESFDVYGADAMRWYLLSSPILRGTDFSVSAAGLRDTAKQILLPLWNCWYFLALYANAAKVEGRHCDGDERPFSDHVLDRYVLGKTRQLVETTTDQLDRFDLSGAAATIRAFVDSLSNWYIRRSRQRFWDGDADAIDTLHTVLDVLTRVSAPLLPMVAETIWRGLNGDAVSEDASVHLTDWPLADELPGGQDLDELVATMDEVRSVCSATLSVRKANQLRVRQPLAALTVAVADSARLAQFRDVIADEVNVRDVVFTDDVASTASEVLQVVPAVLGPRLGGATQQVIKAVRAGEWSRDGDAVIAAGHRLEPGEFTLTLRAAEGTASAALDHGGGVVVLDTELTPALEREGRARDLIRVIQQQRKADGLDVSDRVAITIVGDDSLTEVVEAHRELIAGETLGVSIDVDTSGTSTPVVRVLRSTAPTQ